ncbi:MAG: helicase-related protein [Gemmatimonadota bacterium]
MSEAAAWAALAAAAGDRVSHEREASEDADVAADLAVRIGRVTLLPHQVDAVRRLRRLLRARRVALLADETGLGKTYVACALVRDATRPVVVVPAALRVPWRAALADTAAMARVVSHEGLSRTGTRGPAPDFVVIDEAHHARNPATRRWQHLATLCRDATVLLLSATPIHNRARDLAALFALVAGPDAFAWSLDVLARGVVRRDRRVLGSPGVRRAGAVGAVGAVGAIGDPGGVGAAMPALAPWRWHPAPADPRIAERLEALPPALAAADGADAAPLWRMGLLRAWASSSAALVAALRRRIARGLALDQALRDGRHLTRAQLARWTDDDVATPELPLDDAPHVGTTRRRSAASRDPTGRAAPVTHPPPARDVVLAHLEALGHLLPLVSAAAESHDAARAAVVARTLDETPEARAVLFCTDAVTAAMYWRHLSRRPGVALATGRGGRIASGPVTRDHLFAALDRDGPARRHAREQVRLLVATDVASEGLTLSAASVVWHADLPWTPARVTQRIGRVARLASRHPVVTIHAFAPPDAAESRLGLLPRLDHKADIAAALGTAGPWRDAAGAGAHPARRDPDPPADVQSALARLAAARHACARTQAGRRPTTPGAAPTVVRHGPRRAIVAVLDSTDGPALWTLADAADPDPSPVAAWRALADVAWDAPPPRDAARVRRAALARLRDAMRRHGTAASVGHADGGPTAVAPATARLLARLAGAVRDTAPHRRAAAVSCAAAWRRRLAAPVPAGWQPELLALATSPVRGDAWWVDAATLRSRLPPPSVPGAPRAIAALFVLVGPQAGR